MSVSHLKSLKSAVVLNVLLPLPHQDMLAASPLRVLHPFQRRRHQTLKIPSNASTS